RVWHSMKVSSKLGRHKRRYPKAWLDKAPRRPVRARRNPAARVWHSMKVSSKLGRHKRRYPKAWLDKAPRRPVR
ncbi:hypothetical protein, partial [Salmonella enterica]|uniref:hypothetical protein n=1 Tax=Salmonella enterica TaxID=28901 RepID=UPI002FCD70C5